MFSFENRYSSRRLRLAEMNHHRWIKLYFTRIPGKAKKTAQKHFHGSALRFRKRDGVAADRTPAAATSDLVSDQLYCGGVSRGVGT
jgi:hypothetical protein